MNLFEKSNKTDKEWTSNRDIKSLQAKILEISTGKLNLPENMAKPSWENMSAVELFDLLADEIVELYDALRNGHSVKDVENECADVINFAGMIAHVVSKRDS